MPVKRARRWPRLTLSATTSQGSDGGANLDGDADTSVGLALSWELGARKARENLVDYPFRDTFKRPLGDLDGMGSPAAAYPIRDQ